MKKLYGFVCMTLLGFSHPLLADSPYQASKSWHGIIGLGVLFRTEPYKVVDNRTWLLPHLIMRRGNFFIDGLEIGYHAAETTQGSFDLILKPHIEGFDADDSAFLDGMEDREFSLDGGIATRWRQGTVEFKFSAVTDILDKSGGKEITASLGKTYILTGQMTLITPRLGLKWQNDNLVNYYYGVKQTQARADRPAYRGKATLNYTIAVNATYSLTKRSTLFADIEYERFGDDIYDSPLVDKEQIFTVFLGYGWQF
ncbi:MAG: MipA/OmpV family protein [Pseudomonadota bacterium]